MRITEAGDTRLSCAVDEKKIKLAMWLEYATQKREINFGIYPEKEHLLNCQYNNKSV